MRARSQIPTLACAPTAALITMWLVTGFAPSAHAEDSACAPRANVLAHLSGQYREAPVAVGHADNGGVIEVMRSNEHGTFTIIITMPDGITCMIAAGSNWEDLPVLAQDARL